jgi:hypothetical protein
MTADHRLHAAAHLIASVALVEFFTAVGLDGPQPAEPTRLTPG